VLCPGSGDCAEMKKHGKKKNPTRTHPWAGRKIKRAPLLNRQSGLQKKSRKGTKGLGRKKTNGKRGENEASPDPLSPTPSWPVLGPGKDGTKRKKGGKQIFRSGRRMRQRGERHESYLFRKNHGSTSRTGKKKRTRD